MRIVGGKKVSVIKQVRKTEILNWGREKGKIEIFLQNIFENITKITITNEWKVYRGDQKTVKWMSSSFFIQYPF